MVPAKGAFLRVATSPAVLAAGEIGESGPRRGDEKMAFERLAKKLYFNISWPNGATTGTGAVTKFIPCTPFRSSVTIGDRYGSLLEAVAAVTGNSANALKRAGTVSAWFVPADANTPNATSAATLGVYVDFCAPTLQGPSGGTNTDNVPLLPYLCVDGTSQARNRGKDTIYGTLGQPRHFSVRLRRTNAVTLGHTLSGTLYVARQHSIEV